MPAAVAAQSFVHPGGLHTKADLDRMKAKVMGNQHPWIDGWNKFIADPKARNTYKAGPGANMPSRQRAQDDATAMYYNALRWYISGDESYAECAVRIANGWSSTVNKAPANDYLTGIPVGSFALAAEVLRVYPRWSESDFSKFKAMLLEQWYPKCNDFLTNHGGSPDSHYWANWDACNMLGVLAMGVLCDDRAKFDQAVEYFKYGKGMGSIRNATPFRYPGGLAQWQESGRDQAHTMGGMGLLAEFCQVAWNQGVDLFAYDESRLLAAAEYAAQYTLWRSVPYTFYTNADHAKQPYISENYHGRLDASHFELLYNHYVVGRGLKAPHVKRLAELRRPEPGEADVFGYGTLTFTLDATASPYPVFPAPPVPQDLVATAGLGRVELRWSPSGAYSAHGYEVFRATARTGPYTSLYSTNRWTTPCYTDTKVENGTAYFYKVAALNNSGTSAPSAPVSASPVAGGALPPQLVSIDIGGAGAGAGDLYAELANPSLLIPATGADIGGKQDNCHCVYQSVSGDFTIGARLIERNGSVNKMGLLMRESPEADAKMVCVTLGEIGGRQARFGSRLSTGGATSTQSGSDYTWLPVWFQLSRQGDVFTGSQSSDGVTWFPVGTSTVAMAKAYLIGVVAAVGKSGGPASWAAFDHLSISAVAPNPPECPSGLAAASVDKSCVRLTWKYPTIKPTGFKIEASSDGQLYYEIADLSAAATSFVNTGLSEPAGTSYRMRAYNPGGYSGYSNFPALDALSAPQPVR